MGPAAGDARAIARSAAGIYAGAMLIGAIEEAIPGGPQSSLLPAIAALVLAPLAAILGPRMPGGSSRFSGRSAPRSSPTRSSRRTAGPTARSCTCGRSCGCRTSTAAAGRCSSSRGSASCTRSPWPRCPPVSGTSTAGSTSRSPWPSSAPWCARCPSAPTASSRASSRGPGGHAHRAAQPPRLRGAPRRGGRARDPRATSLALVTFDLDHFKRVNDDQGHEAGDRALAMVGAVIADHRECAVAGLVALVVVDALEVVEVEVTRASEHRSRVARATSARASSKPRRLSSPVSVSARASATRRATRGRSARTARARRRRRRPRRP